MASIDTTPSSLTEEQGDLRTLASGAGIAIAGRLTGRALDVSRQAILARLLPIDVFGVYALAITVFRLVLSLAPLGTSSSLIRMAFAGRDNLARFRAVVRTGLDVAAVLGVIFGVLLFASSRWIAVTVFNEPSLEPMLYVFAIAVPFSVVMRVSLAATTMTRRIGFSVAMEEIVQPGLTLVLLIVFAAAFQTLGALNAVLLATIISLAICAWMARRQVFARFPELRGRIENGGTPLAVEIVRFGTPLAFASLFLWTTPLIDRLLIGFFVPPEEAGVYIVVAQLATLFTLIAAAIETIQSPLTAGLIHLGNTPRLERLVQSAVRLGLLLGTPALMVVLVEGRTLLELIFGPAFGAGSTALLVLSAASILRVMSDRAIALLVMAGHNRQWLTYSTVAFIINIALDLLFIPWFGIVGAALSTVVVNVFLLLALAIATWQRVRIRLFTLSFLWFIPGALLGVAVGLLPQWLGLPMSPLVRLCLFSMLSLATLLLFSWQFALTDEERSLLSSLVRRFAPHKS